MSIVAMGCLVFIILAFLLTSFAISIGTGMSGTSYESAFLEFLPGFLLAMIPAFLIGSAFQWRYWRTRREQPQFVEWPSANPILVTIATVVVLYLLYMAFFWFLDLITHGR